MRRSWRTGVAVGALVALTACGGESLTESAIEEATGVEIDQDGNVVSISTDEGSIRVDDSGNVEVVTSDGEQVFSGGQEGELPEGFPGDIPLPDLEVLNSLASSTNGEESWLLNFTADDAKGAYDSYVAELEGAGYTIENVMVSDAGGIFSALSSASNGTWEIGIIAADDSGMSLTVQASGA